MNEIEIIKEIMKTNGISGAVMAEKLGYKTPTGVYNRLNSKSMTVETLINLLEAMDCELVIRRKVGEKESYQVKNENRGEVKSYRKGDK